MKFYRTRYPHDFLIITFFFEIGVKQIGRIVPQLIILSLLNHFVFAEIAMSIHSSLSALTVNVFGCISIFVHIP